MKKKQWIPIAPNAQEGEISLKSINNTNFKKVASLTDQLGRTSIHYELKGLWEGSETYENVDYATLSMSEAGNMQIEGAPSLPQEGLFVAIPENAEFKEIKILHHELVDIKDEFLILPAAKPVYEGEKVEYIPDAKIYQSNDVYPGKLAEYIGTTYVADVKVAHIMLYLAQYVPLDKKLSALKSIDFEIIYETNDGLKDSIKPRAIDKAFSSFVLGYEEDTTSDLQESSEKGTDASKLKDPNNYGNLLIITTSDLISSFTPYVKAKSAKYTVKVVKKEDIISEFPAPSDEPKSIREFLMYAWRNWKLPPQYVILGGNIDKVPTCIRNYNGAKIPSDQYYAALAGDINPDIVVSRFPASTTTEMSQLCNTAIKYDQTREPWRKNILFTTYNSSGYNDCKDRIATAIRSSFNVIKKYDGSASKNDVINTINQGVGFINYRGHGSNTSWQAGNGLNNNDIPNLKNGDKIPQVLSIACSNNAIDYRANNRYDCFGINWIRQQKAITFLGASRPSYTSVNHIFDEYLWEGINKNKLEKAGDIFKWATLKLYKNYPSSAYQENIYMYLLLGDPTANY